MLTQATAYRMTELQAEVETNDPYQLGILLVNGAITFTQQAQTFMKENKIADKCQKISRAFDIVLYLKSMLDYEEGGKIVANIAQLLQFIQDQLVMGNIKNNLNCLMDAEKILIEVKECFLLCQQKANK